MKPSDMAGAVLKQMHPGACYILIIDGSIEDVNATIQQLQKLKRPRECEMFVCTRAWFEKVNEPELQALKKRAMRG